jgi:radical SAM protein with 4Fe4S-binding SPASM domain
MWDGSITVCKNDYYGKLSMGNVNKTTIHKCWTESLNYLRMFHQNGNSHKVDACIECPLRMSELIKRKEVEEN